MREADDYLEWGEALPDLPLEASIMVRVGVAGLLLILMIMGYGSLASKIPRVASLGSLARVV